MTYSKDICVLGANNALYNGNTKILYKASITI